MSAESNGQTVNPSVAKDVKSIEVVAVNYGYNTRYGSNVINDNEMPIILLGDNRASRCSLVHLLGGPLLLSKSSSLPISTYDEIKRLGAYKVGVLGGRQVHFHMILSQNLLKMDRCRTYIW